MKSSNNYIYIALLATDFVVPPPDAELLLRPAAGLVLLLAITMKLQLPLYFHAITSYRSSATA
jgi:hypothetical protein